MSATAPPKQEPLKDKDLDKIEFKLTDLELQFISDEIIRRDQTLQDVMKKSALSIQHFVAVCALKKNLQFDQERFVGVNVEPDKKRAYLLLRK